MAWDFETLWTEVQNEVDDDDSDALTVIKQGLNDGGQKIWRRAKWPFRKGSQLISSVSGQQTYDLETLITSPTFGRIDVVVYKGQNETKFLPLNFVDWLRFQSDYSDTVATGRPSIWTLRNNTLYLYVTPNYSGSSNLRVDHDKKFTLLSAAADVPAVPEDFKDAMKAYARYRYFMFDDDTRANEELREFERILREQLAEYFGRVGPTRGKLFRA